MFHADDNEWLNRYTNKISSVCCLQEMHFINIRLCKEEKLGQGECWWEPESWLSEAGGGAPQLPLIFRRWSFLGICGAAWWALTRIHHSLFPLVRKCTEADLGSWSDSSLGHNLILFTHQVHSAYLGALTTSLLTPQALDGVRADFWIYSESSGITADFTSCYGLKAGGGPGGYQASFWPVWFCFLSCNISDSVSINTEVRKHPSVGLFGETA